MTAPHTNIEKEKFRHRGPLVGMAAVVLFAGVLFLAYLTLLSDGGQTPVQTESQTDGRTGESVPVEVPDPTDPADPAIPNDPNVPDQAPLPAPGEPIAPTDPPLPEPRDPPIPPARSGFSQGQSFAAYTPSFANVV